ncbi:cyclic nucleotide-binding domain-containing protein [Oryzicola mucosus]|uniref:Cyclic nucleotide-binding domain-containing protein n=1 Tax=Oryzicola mucosus TaxID=2767425 RepID=A0A8J6PTR2_9HYPH|nr:cyclic nucleotide-binding domain-containing protein [Oryzicola mucosus]MBD0413933.1 cyclic nucleotide-binding domain-containing protein [Oryzicola mucosus]
MALDDDIRILSGVKLFEDFTPEQLRLLAFGAESVALPAGRKLYLEDDEAETAYVVVRGRVNLFRENGGEVVKSAGPGALLGEMALIADTRRMTSAVSAEDSEVLRLSRKMFRRILEEYPDVAGMLRARIIEDIQALIGQIEGVASRFEN